MTVLIDAHCHTMRYSMCSVLTPEALVKRAVEMCLDGVVIAEHGHCWSSKEVEELLHACGGPGLVVLRAQEVTTTTGEGFFHGDLLVFGLEEPINGRPETRDVLEEVHAAGGIAIAAHPYRQGYGYDDDVLDLPVDGLEVLNSNYFMIDKERAAAAQRAMGVAALGGSDAHSEEWVGRFLTLFEDPVACEGDFIAAVKARRCRALSYGEAALLLDG